MKDKPNEWAKLPGPRYPNVAETKSGGAKERVCMRFRQVFLSQHKSVRRCDYCRKVDRILKQARGSDGFMRARVTDAIVRAVAKRKTPASESA